MKYYEVKFTITAPAAFMQDARDLLQALAGEAGFETFEDTPQGCTGYVQRQLFQPAALQSLIETFPLPSVTIAYAVVEAEDKDWNAAWEQEGFQPIVVGSRCVVHDGRHLASVNLEQFPVSIEIDAHLAFGTGTHQTTRMMLSTLLGLDLAGRRVLDCGTGTGILAIAALKMGAASAVGYDIDEWSTDNARHNAVINRVDDRLTFHLGDVKILNKVREDFDVVMANINRNILLSDMEAMARKMAPGGILVLSGFYEADVPLLAGRAAELGLDVTDSQHDGDWACLTLRKAHAGTSR